MESAVPCGKPCTVQVMLCWAALKKYELAFKENIRLSFADWAGIGPPKVSGQLKENFAVPLAEGPSLSFAVITVDTSPPATPATVGLIIRKEEFIRNPWAVKAGDQVNVTSLVHFPMHV